LLDYSALAPFMPEAAVDAPSNDIMARSHGMLIVEVGVAFTVSAIMFGIYTYLSSMGRLKGGL
jgi:multicomponent Na+:H+ antiporter subunit B